MEEKNEFMNSMTGAISIMSAWRKYLAGEDQDLVYVEGPPVLIQSDLDAFVDNDSLFGSSARAQYSRFYHLECQFEADFSKSVKTML